MRTNPVLARLGAYAIGEIQNAARAMRDAGQQLTDFSIGDPREPTPAFIRRAMQEGVPEVSQYPTVRGLDELREAAAGYVRRRFDVTIDPAQQVLPTSGSKEAIFSTPLAFVEGGSEDTVVWPTPGYPIYERGALLAGARGFPVALGGDYRFAAGLIPDEVWERTRMVWICSPHNPTGSVMSRDDIAGIVERASEVGALVCSDECYVDLYEGDPPPSVLEVAREGAAGVLSFLSLSKRSGMTGYRSGLVVGDPEAISVLAGFRTSVGTAQPEHTQRAAVAAWSDDHHVVERRQVFAAKRRVLRAAFEKLGMEVVGSTAGIYLWVRVGDDVAVSRRLLEAGIVVSPGRAFGPGGEGHIRLALVPALEECDEAAEAVIRCMTET